MRTGRFVMSIPWLFSLGLCVACADTSVPAPGDSQREMAQYLIGQMQASRAKVSNFRCNVSLRDKRLNFHKGGAVPVPPSVAEIITRGKNPDPRSPDAPDWIFQGTDSRLAFDSKGHGRIEGQSGPSDPNGRFLQSNDRIVATWDGRNAIWYGDGPSETRRPAAIISNEQPFETTDRNIMQVWEISNYICTHLADVVKGTPDETYRVEKNGDGKYQVTFTRPNGQAKLAIIDPWQGYSVIEERNLYDGKQSYHEKVTYAEVAPGIWFPVRVEYTNGPEGKAWRSSVSEVTDIVINDPRFYDGLYHVEFRKGTFVRNLVTGTTYTVGETAEAERRQSTEPNSGGTLPASPRD